MFKVVLKHDLINHIMYICTNSEIVFVCVVVVFVRIIKAVDYK